VFQPVKGAKICFYSRSAHALGPLRGTHTSRPRHGGGILTAPFTDLYFSEPSCQLLAGRIAPKTVHRRRTHNPETSVQFCGNRDGPCCCACQTLTGDRPWLWTRTFSIVAHSEVLAQRRAPARFLVWRRGRVVVWSTFFDLDCGTRNRVGHWPRCSGALFEGLECGAFRTMPTVKTTTSCAGSSLKGVYSSSLMRAQETYVVYLALKGPRLVVVGAPQTDVGRFCRGTHVTRLQSRSPNTAAPAVVGPVQPGPCSRAGN
jgi:hypothetical protein